MLKRLNVLVCAIIIMAIVVSAMPGRALAQAKTSDAASDKAVEKLVLKAKEVFNIKDVYDNFEVNSSTDNEYGTIYNLSWTKKDGSSDVNVSISKDMHITNYNIYDNKKYETLKPNYSYDALKKYALDMIKKIDPVNAKSLKLNENSYRNIDSDNAYNFNFDRYVNGKHVLGDVASITISYLDKSIQMYSLNYNHGFDFSKTDEFDSLKSNLTMDEAIKIYKDNEYLKPMIKFVINEKKEPRLTFKTIYSNELNANYYVNSTTKKYERYNYPIFLNNYMKKDAAATEEAMDGLSEYEVKGIDKIKGIKSKDEAVKKAKTFVKDASKAKVTLSTLNQDYISKDYVYNINMESGKDEKKTFYNISLDAKDLTLLRYNVYSNFDKSDSNKKDLSPDELKKIAMDYIKKNASDIADKSLELINTENNSVYFVRVIDGYYVPENFINIDISKDTKEVNSYSRTWYRKALNYDKAKISTDEAYDLVKKEIDYEEVYQYIRDNSDPAKSKVVMSYIPKSARIEIDAISGKLAKNSNEFRNYSDLEKSKYKDKATLLKQMGYSYLENEIMPEKNLKQKDFVSFMYRYGSKDIDKDDAIDDAYQRAIRNGIIKENEVNKEKELSTIDLAKYMVRLKDMEELVGKDIFKPVNAKAKLTNEENSYLSLAKALGYINYDTVDKNAKINRDEFINIAYNYVFK
ncbi:YcdB/YcdC domain-containing protein [Fenollaria sporofastidiosus]|uniref:YcdB/YcdC domain-containing protein n=1 Tax=Fenollaria sporofastidiosus TaxID=2811778 RepID=UPI001C000B9B|nr:YcdB/YcdC domain-containing protein [Fenollaria sporofastidiosus]